jgi:hypothetical protein
VRAAQAIALGLATACAFCAGCGGSGSPSGSSSTPTVRGPHRKLPAPPLTPAQRQKGLLPNTTSFWDTERGLVGTGAEYSGRFGGAILLTSDGGKEFHPVFRTPGEVWWVESAGTDDAWAYVKTRGHPNPALLHTVDGGRSWHKLPSTRTWAASFATPSLGLAIRGPMQNDRGDLLQSSDGGRTWKRIGGPCPSYTGFVSYPASDEAWMLCLNVGIGGGAQPKGVYASTDGGRSWQPKAGASLPNRNSTTGSGLTEGGYLHGIAFSNSGFGYLLGEDGPSYLTHDGGADWQKQGLPRSAYETLSASLLPGGVGFALTREPVLRLWRTDDAGGSWTLAHRWQSR